MQLTALPLAVPAPSLLRPVYLSSGSSAMRLVSPLARTWRSSPKTVSAVNVRSGCGVQAAPYVLRDLHPLTCTAGLSCSYAPRCCVSGHVTELWFERMRVRPS